VLYLMPLMAVNRCWNGAILSTEVMLFAIFWPVVFLAILLWLGACSVRAYVNRTYHNPEES